MNQIDFICCLWLQLYKLICNLDKPSPPENLVAFDVTESSLKLKWTESADDGGAVIQSYIIEKREASKKTWTKVTTTRELNCTVSDLKEGCQYMFRVAAENSVGVGEYNEMSQAVTAKPQYGMYY